jgi:hypothetical protein
MCMYTYYVIRPVSVFFIIDLILRILDEKRIP